MKAGFAQSIAKDCYWIWDQCFTENEIQNFLKFSQLLYEKGKFRDAQVGKDFKKQKAKQIRSDQICWINEPYPQELLPFYNLLKEIQDTARRELYLPIKRFESHLACYEPKAFYKKHIDRHTHQPSRILSSALYLSPWSRRDGGELVIYDENARAVNIEPKPGRLVVFDSDLEHEVRTTNVFRWSITTWFRDDLEGRLRL